MATNDDLYTASTSRNQILSLIATLLQSSFPVGSGNAKLKSFTVAGVPSAAGEGQGTMIYVTDESGGAVPAFSDGTNWRRVTDRNIIS